MPLLLCPRRCTLIRLPGRSRPSTRETRIASSSGGWGGSEKQHKGDCAIPVACLSWNPVALGGEGVNCLPSVRLHQTAQDTRYQYWSWTVRPPRCPVDPGLFRKRGVWNTPTCGTLSRCGNCSINVYSRHGLDFRLHPHQPPAPGGGPDTPRHGSRRSGRTSSASIDAGPRGGRPDS